MSLALPPASNQSAASPKSSPPQALSNLPTVGDSPTSGHPEIGDGPGRKFPTALVLVGAGGAILAATLLFIMFKRDGNVSRPDLLLHTVKTEDLDLTVIERGTLESADNRDIICRVKAGSKGNYATTIKWVIDDGTPVRKGQLLMTLDSSALEDQLRTQKIALDKSHAEWVAAEQQFKIQLSTNESAVEKAKSDIQLRELDLEKYVGLPKGTLARLGRETARELLLEMEASLEQFFANPKRKGMFPDAAGEFHKLVNDLVGQIELARADVEMWRDRHAYSKRMSEKGFLSPAQVLADEARWNGSKNTLTKLEQDRMLLQKFTSQVDVRTKSAAVQEAWRAYDRAVSEAKASEVQKEADRKTKRSVYVQEEEKLREIEEQIRECKIHAPQDGMVVYFIPESSRWSQSERGLIQQGASVQEGQKLMRIPDLGKMQVATRVHEAMVSRIRGDDRRSTGVHESVTAALLLNPTPVTAALPVHEAALEDLRDEYRAYEYYEHSRGMPATVRVDAFPERVFRGHVKTVATVASATDWMASDVKVYSTVVAIDDEAVPGMKPGMNAEVTIHVNKTLTNVLAIPVQAVIGGAESGAKRKVFVMTPGGPEEREVELGLSNEKMAEVRNGLQAGDQVVVNPKAILGNAAKTREEMPEAGPKGPGKGKGFGGKGKGKGPGGPPEGGMPGGGGDGSGSGGQGGSPGNGAPGGGFGKGGGGGPPGGGLGKGGPPAKQ